MVALNDNWKDLYVDVDLYHGLMTKITRDNEKCCHLALANVEICCGSYTDALQAAKGGARRIELNTSLEQGGLTASPSVVRLIKANLDLTINAMVRCRAGGFHYSDDDFLVMKSQALELMEAGADGIVFGFLDRHRKVDYLRVQEFVHLIHSYNKKAIFHRAFDVCADPLEAMAVLIELGVDVLLTSGKKQTALEGKDLIRYLVGQYGKQIEIVAGSGITHENAKELVCYTQVKSIHSSCKKFVKDATATYQGVSFETERHGQQAVSGQKVKLLLEEVV